MADVKFKRLDTANRILEAVEDGKYILDYERPSIYLDEGTTRIELTPRDTALSTTSTNPIENQALTNSIINTLAEVLAITTDAVPCGTKPLKELNTTLSNLISSISPVVLWTNPNQYNTFAGGNITISESISNFTKYEILYKPAYNVNYMQTTGKIPIAFLTHLIAPYDLLIRRTVSAISGTTVTFTDGYIIATYGTPSLNNAYCIPYQIIGYK